MTARMGATPKQGQGWVVAVRSHAVHWICPRGTGAGEGVRKQPPDGRRRPGGAGRTAGRLSELRGHRFPGRCAGSRGGMVAAGG